MAKPTALAEDEYCMPAESVEVAPGRRESGEVAEAPRGTGRAVVEEVGTGMRRPLEELEVVRREAGGAGKEEDAPDNSCIGKGSDAVEAALDTRRSRRRNGQHRMGERYKVQLHKVQHQRK